MIIELTKQNGGNNIFVVDQIESVSIDKDLHNNEYHFHLVINTKGNNRHRVFYGIGKYEKESINEDYNKVKEALLTFYKKDVIADEIKKYLETLK